MQEMTRISFALGTSAMINTKPQIGDKNWDMDKWTLHKNVHPDKICQILILINMQICRYISLQLRKNKDARVVGALLFPIIDYMSTDMSLLFINCISNVCDLYCSSHHQKEFTSDVCSFFVFRCDQHFYSWPCRSQSVTIVEIYEYKG